MLGDRPRRACHDRIDTLITQASATLRRRGTDDIRSTCGRCALGTTVYLIDR